MAHRALTLPGSAEPRRGQLSSRDTPVARYWMFADMVTHPELVQIEHVEPMR